jgi:hypothetical protein
VDTFNPAKIAVFEWRQIWADATQPGLTWGQRLRYLFAPPGWSHDGSRQTSEQLRAAQQAAKS